MGALDGDTSKLRSFVPEMEISFSHPPLPCHLRSDDAKTGWTVHAFSGFLFVLCGFVILCFFCLLTSWPFLHVWSPKVLLPTKCEVSWVCKGNFFPVAMPLFLSVVEGGVCSGFKNSNRYRFIGWDGATEIWFHFSNGNKYIAANWSCQIHISTTEDWLQKIPHWISK